MKVKVNGGYPQHGITLDEIPVGHLASVAYDSSNKGRRHYGIGLKLDRGFDEDHPTFVWFRCSMGEVNQSPYACSPSCTMRFHDLGEADITLNL
jgi:hypothetical protein